jgi:hypothetical protein
MKTLIIRPLGGLANRMRVIETAMAFAANHSAEVIILWEKSNILNAYYEQCFESLPNVKIINIDCSGNNFFFRLKRKIINRLFLWIGNFIFDIRLYDSTIKNYLNDDRTPKPEEIFFTRVAETNNKVYFETCYEFVSVSQSSPVIIKQSIRERAINFLKPYGRFIGVHIRRTDSLEAIENSPIELFIERMDALIRQSSSVKFYISTDSEEVLNNLKNIYNEKVFTATYERTRHTAEGIISALVDLYCLSKSEMILGSFYSSFSQMAAKTGNVPLEIVAKNV